MMMNPFANYFCSGVPCRPSRRFSGGISEAGFAEEVAYYGFREDFLKRHVGGLVVSQLDYKKIAACDDPGIQFVLSAMQTYFRNWWSRNNPEHEGRARKPDGLGISKGGHEIEIIEVKPLNNYQDGVEQLNEMIEKISTGLMDYYTELTPPGKVTRVPFDPSRQTVKGSHWKPGPSIEVVHLRQTSNSYDWICFKPTKRTLRSGARPVDGVILYEVHSVLQKDKHLIPKDVARRLGFE
jgi:hypothetical protein